jgi:16S rRNA (guanine527-N7)-methyltransferase
MRHIDGPEAFREAFDVSRETLERLVNYAELLEKWNRRINLVGRSTLPDLWHRHIADSAQLWGYAPPNARLWLDLGSGAGLPGLVIAAITAEKAPALTVALVESDRRKCAFLEAARREMGLEVRIHAERLESLPPQQADVISARALAPLKDLLKYAEIHRRPGGIGLFPKGETVHIEIEEALSVRKFEHRNHLSRTDSQAAIVEIGAIYGVRHTL